MKERYKALALSYGWVFVAMVVMTLVVTMTVFFIAISAGVDVPALLGRVGLQLGERPAGASTFLVTLGLAYAGAKVLSLPRLAIAAALTPLAARVIQKHKPHWLPKPPAESAP